MPVQSMTGFARTEGQTSGVEFVWELRSVNGKGFDIRLRIPQGFEALEAPLRRVAAQALSRGNIQANLQIRRQDEAPSFIVNEAMLDQIVALSNRLTEAGHATRPTADGILAIKGVIDVAEKPAEDDLREAREAAITTGFSACLTRLVAAREDEGRALEQILAQRLDEIAALVGRAEADPVRSSDAIRERLAVQVRALVEADERLDAQRLHQEAAILAAKADIREEIDRLAAHVDAARGLLAGGGAIGRRLDFLSQEFNRESNTICSKSNAASLTAIGLELKVIVDQFREQVQNLRPVEVHGFPQAAVYDSSSGWSAVY